MAYAHYTITEIEDRVIAALTAQMTYIRTCKSYHGELEGKLDDILLVVPAALVVLTRRKSEQLEGGIHGHAHVRTHQFTIFLAASDARGESEARRKVPAGIYHMIEDCDAALLDQKLGMNIPFPFRGGNAEIVLVRGPLVVYAVHYEIDIYEV